MARTDRARRRSAIDATGPRAQHPLILPFRLATVLAAQLFDFATFLLMVGRRGIGAEANPLVAQGFALYGMPAPALMKVLLVVLLGSIVVVLARERVRRGAVRDPAAFVAVLAALAGLVGGISNILSS